MAYHLIMRLGANSVSMDDIARKLSISKKTIYQHFENKQNLIREIIQVKMNKDFCVLEEIEKNSSDAIDEMVKIARHVLITLREMSPAMLFDMKKYYPEEWHLINQMHFVHVREIIQNNIHRGIKENIYRSDIEVDIISELYVNMTQNLVDEDVFPLNTYKRDELYRALITYHMYGIVNDQGLSKLKTLTLD